LGVLQSVTIVMDCIMLFAV